MHEGESTWHARNVRCSFWYCNRQLLCIAHDKCCLQHCAYSCKQFSFRSSIKNDVSIIHPHMVPDASLQKPYFKTSLDSRMRCTQDTRDSRNIEGKETRSSHT